MFKVTLSSQATKDLKRLSKTIFYKNIRKGLTELQENPLMGDVVALKNFPLAAYRKRVGAYRILFDIIVNEKIVFIHTIQHRKDVYTS